MRTPRNRSTCRDHTLSTVTRRRRRKAVGRKHKAVEDETYARSSSTALCFLLFRLLSGAGRVVVDDLDDHVKRDFDDLTIGAFDLNARFGERLRHLQTLDDAAHTVASFGDDLYILFTVERLQGREGFCDFHCINTILSKIPATNVIVRRALNCSGCRNCCTKTRRASALKLTTARPVPCVSVSRRTSGRKEVLSLAICFLQWHEEYAAND